MNTFAQSFINELASGDIEVEKRFDPNQKGELRLNFSRKGSENYDTGLLTSYFFGMPDVWEAVRYTDSAGSFIYNTNGFVISFVSYNPEAMGAYAMGKLNTTLGTIDVKGGWSSRAGVLHKLTNLKSVEVTFNRAVIYITLEAAEAIAEKLGLKIGRSGYGQRREGFVYNEDFEEETSWAFFEK